MMPSESTRAGTSPLKRWLASDAFPRIVPFGLFMVFVAAGSWLPAPVPVPEGELDGRWIFAARALVAGAALIWLWPKFEELRFSQRLSASDWILAAASGVVVLILWVSLDHGWVTFALTDGFDPRRYGESRLDWPVTFFRLLGLAVVVPIAEELFWRSFILRWLERQNFLNVAPRTVGMRALAVTSVLFALEHTQWLAGLIAGVVYGLVYMRAGKLWVPVIAHAVTNTGLGAYILFTEDWRFW